MQNRVIIRKFSDFLEIMLDFLDGIAKASVTKKIWFSTKNYKKATLIIILYFLRKLNIRYPCNLHHFTLLWFSWNPFHFSLFQKFTMKGNSRFLIFWKCVSNFIKIYIFCVFFQDFLWQKRWKIGCSKQKSKTCFSSLKNIFFMKFGETKIPYLCPQKLSKLE